MRQLKDVFRDTLEKSTIFPRLINEFRKKFPEKF